MTDLDERIYYREEQFQPFLTVNSGRPPEFLNDDGELAAETTITGLRADGTTWMALGPGRESGHEASGNQMSLNTTC